MSNGKSPMSHASFLRLYRWVEAHKDYLETKPLKAQALAKATKELGFNVSKFTLNNCLKEAGIWYADRKSMGKNQGPKVSMKLIAGLLLRTHNILREDVGRELLDPEQISLLQSVRDGYTNGTSK